MDQPGGFDLLVVSDLHLSEGRDDKSRAFSRHEDFLVDEEFGRFLDCYRERRDRSDAGGKGWHLILNGDTFDFLQVLRLDSRAGVPCGKYGPRCGEKETVEKLKRIGAGHPIFFRSLAAFVAAGNRLTVISGNHDAELVYPRVREEFRDQLASALASWQKESQVAPARTLVPISSGNVDFRQWFYYEPHLLWVEHGHQFEGWNSYKYWLAPFLPRRWGLDDAEKNDIDLPCGSFLVRYLLNRVESDDPYADNIKPTTKYVGYLFRKHPLRALRFALTGGWVMHWKMWRAWWPVCRPKWQERHDAHRTALASLQDDVVARGGFPEEKADILEKLDAAKEPSVLREPRRLGVILLRVLVLAWLALPLLLVACFAVLGAGAVVAVRTLDVLAPGRLPRWLAGFADVVFPWLLVVLAVLAVVLAVALALGRLFAHVRRRKNSLPGYLAAAAKRIADAVEVPYVAMGHTHDPELCAIGPGEAPDRSREYFNTGTWTKVYDEKARPIRDESEFDFLEGRRRGGDLRMRLNKWDAAAGEPRLARLRRVEECAGAGN